MMICNNFRNFHCVSDDCPNISAERCIPYEEDELVSCFDCVYNAYISCDVCYFNGSSCCPLRNGRENNCAK